MSRKKEPSAGTLGGKQKNQKIIRPHQFNKPSLALQRELSRLALIQSRTWGGDAA